jgi:hypothetical protein
MLYNHWKGQLRTYNIFVDLNVTRCLLNKALSRCQDHSFKQQHRDLILLCTSVKWFTYLNYYYTCWSCAEVNFSYYSLALGSGYDQNARKCWKLWYLVCWYTNIFVSGIVDLDEWWYYSYSTHTSHIDGFWCTSFPWASSKFICIWSPARCTYGSKIMVIFPTFYMTALNVDVLHVADLSIPAASTTRYTKPTLRSENRSIQNIWVKATSWPSARSFTG